MLLRGEHSRPETTSRNLQGKKSIRAQNGAKGPDSGPVRAERPQRGPYTSSGSSLANPPCRRWRRIGPGLGAHQPLDRIGGASAMLPSLREAKRRSNPASCAAARLIASLSLATTVRDLSPDSHVQQFLAGELGLVGDEGESRLGFGAHQPLD